MVSWLLLLALVVVEIFALRWWLNREYYPVLFNGWAILLYTSVFAADILLVWLISPLLETGGNSGLGTLAIIGVVVVVFVALFTFFFRWIVRQDFSEPPQ